MPTNSARTRAGKHATKHRARFGMPAQRFHCTQDHMDGAAAQLAADIKRVEGERSCYCRGPVWDALDDVLTALRTQREVST